MKGFTERLRSEVQNEIPAAQIIAPDNRHYSVWVGGAIFAAHLLSSSAVGGFITNETYDKHGASVLRLYTKIV